MKDNKASLQKVPKKPKKRNYKIKSEDKEKIAKFYLELDEFMVQNETKLDSTLNKVKYICEYNELKTQFYLKEFDHSKFKTYGMIKNKLLYLTDIEVFYLNQIGMIKVDIDMNELLNTININLLNLYCYLSRSGYIVKCCSLLNENDSTSNKYEKFLIWYENNDNYEENKIEGIIYCHSDKKENLTYHIINEINNITKEIIQKVSNINNSSFKIVIAFCNGISITFINLKVNNIFN